MACLNLPKISPSIIPGLSLPTTVPGLPPVSLSIPNCCGGSIGPSVNLKDYLPPTPIPPGPILPTPLIVALQTIISSLNSALDLLPDACPLDGGS